jgi:hypothetical protein
MFSGSLKASGLWYNGSDSEASAPVMVMVM